MTATSDLNEGEHSLGNEDAIKIVWDGETAIVVRKPAGILTQSPPGTDGLEQRLMRQLAGRAEYLTAVHRLDRPVTGLVLIALRKRTARLLSDQFATRKVAKSYLAWVGGDARSAAGQTWVDQLLKLAGQPQVRLASGEEGGKRAETEVDVLRFDEPQGRTLLRLRPLTGRMHQLRVQAASRGWPILGDDLYGGAAIDGFDRSRIALHAESIEFHDPRNGRRVFVSDPASFASPIGTVVPPSRSNS